MQLLEKAVRMNGVTHLVFNKVDVLRAVSRWAVIDHGKVVKFKTEKAMKLFLLKRLKPLGLSKARVYFSESKEII